jgi:hypothetical protein
MPGVLEGHRDDLEFIVSTMRAMKFFFAQTRYEHIVGQMIRADLRYRGRFDRDECSELAKDEAMDGYMRQHSGHPGCMRGVPPDLFDRWRHNNPQEPEVVIGGEGDAACGEAAVAQDDDESSDYDSLDAWAT